MDTGYGLASLLMRESELARQHLSLGSTGAPSLRDQNKFEEDFRVAKESHLGRERAFILREGGGGEGSTLIQHKKRSRPRINADLAELWLKNSPNFCTTGLRLTAAEAQQAATDAYYANTGNKADLGINLLNNFCISTGFLM